MTDSSGNIVNKYAYDEFGNLTGYVESIPNPFRYVGKYGVMDEGNGLLFMRARYYDPEIGRFLTPDPLNLSQIQIMRDNPQNSTDRASINKLFRYELYNPQKLNAYAYVGNNPVNWNDPWGLWYFDINLTYGAGIGITKGLIIGSKGFYFYIGGGLTTPGASGSITYSPQNQTTGWTVGLQGNYPAPIGAAGQVGYGFGEAGGFFWEIGGSVATSPGASITGYYVVPVFTWGKEDNCN